MFNCENKYKMEKTEKFGQYIVTFDNGYEASVICNVHSYGGKLGLWELCVLLNGYPCYDTPITDDVIGWLTDLAVEELLDKINELPKR